MRAPIARANPAAKLAVAVTLSGFLVLSVDVVTAATALVLELLALPWCGLGPGAVWRRSRVLVAAAVPVAVTTALLGLRSGRELATLGPLAVTTGSATDAVAIGVRVLAVGLPGIVLLATTDPTDLADALAQVLRLPARFVLSALAATRLFGVLAEEWQALALARRARGIGEQGPLGRLRTTLGQVFALLVLALRRAGVLATAMEARGFGVVPERTWARPSRLTGGDLALMAGGVLLALSATAAGVLAGTWNFVLA